MIKRTFIVLAIIAYIIIVLWPLPQFLGGVIYNSWSDDGKPKYDTETGAYIVAYIATILGAPMVIYITGYFLYFLYKLMLVAIYYIITGKKDSTVDYQKIKNSLPKISKNGDLSICDKPGGELSKMED